VPQVLGIPKVSAEDQSLTVSNQEGEKRQIILPKGTYVNINTVGMHQNRASGSTNSCMGNTDVACSAILV
jgi:hypothetical protein